MTSLALLIFFIGLSTTMGSVELVLNADATSTMYTADCKTYQYFYFTATNPCKDIKVTVIPTTGDPNIYVSKTKAQPTMDMLTWAQTDSDTLTISQWDPESSPGTYYGNYYI